MRWSWAIFGALLLAFGLGCLNFTNGFGIDHHREWAQAHQLPEPSHAIFACGVVTSILGAGILGHVIARKTARV